jgi:hypothetical protein
VSSASPSTGRLLALLGGGHAVWAVVAHGGALRSLAREHLIGTVGDGVFVQEHARDERAAGFWFLLISPLVMIIGMLVDDAERRGDWRSVQRSCRSGVALSLASAVVVPRSGFPAAILVLARGARRAARARAADAG